MTIDWSRAVEKARRDLERAAWERRERDRMAKDARKLRGYIKEPTVKIKFLAAKRNAR